MTCELVREITNEAICCVRHEDAGGWCQRPATVLVYGLTFCKIHGQEAKIGALESAHHEAWQFFEGLHNLDLPSPASAIRREIEAVFSRLREAEHGDYETALVAAYGRGRIGGPPREGPPLASG